jgi:hypothetical protein
LSSNQQSAISNQQSAISNQQSAISNQKSEAFFHFDGGRAFDVAAETFAHGGENLLSKAVFLA